MQPKNREALDFIFKNKLETARSGDAYREYRHQHPSGRLTQSDFSNAFILMEKEKGAVQKPRKHKVSSGNFSEFALEVAQKGMRFDESERKSIIQVLTGRGAYPLADGLTNLNSERLFRRRFFITYSAQGSPPKISTSHQINTGCGAGDLPISENRRNTPRYKSSRADMVNVSGYFL